MCACINGHAEVVEVLLKTGYDRSPVTYYQEGKEAKGSQGSSATQESTQSNGDDTTGNCSVVIVEEENDATPNPTPSAGGTTAIQESHFNGNSTTGNGTTGGGRGEFVSVLMTAITRKQE